MPAHSTSDSTHKFGATHLQGVNWLGMWTLYVKEVQRFLNLYLQTIGAPIVTTLLYLAIFSIAVGRDRPDIHGISFIAFLAPGLIMMAIIQNAFANTSSSMLSAKIQGNIVDLLMPPLSSAEVTTAFILGGVSRGIVVGAATALAMLAFVDFAFAHIWAIVYFAVMGSLILSIIGTLAGIWADKFDHMASVTNFIIMPLSFLSGSFYSISRLPDLFQQISHFNPFFYLIDGIRYGFTGVADGSVAVGVAVTAGLAAILWWCCHKLLDRGWRLKA